MSTLKVSTLQNLSGTEVYTCKAWVNFNGTGTVAIRASGNVSSITDNGVGDYTVNFTNAMPDANYSVALCSLSNTTSQNIVFGAIKGTQSTGASNKTTTAVTIVLGLGNSAGFQDTAEFNTAVFR